MAENHHLCWIPANLPLSCGAPVFLPAAAEGGGIVLYLQETPLILDHSTPLALMDLISVVVPAFNEERNEFFREQGLKPLPASTGIQAILCRPDLLIEIEAIAMFRTDKDREE